MASLDDFSAPSRVSLDDFASQGPLVPVNNRPSNTNLAAYTAVMSEDPDSLESTYLETSSRLDEGEDKETVEAVRFRANELTQSKDRNAVISILTDPEVSDSKKEQVLANFTSNPETQQSIREVVATESLTADSDGETNESSNARIGYAESVGEVVDMQRRVQGRLNAELNKNNPGLLRSVADFVEILTPFMESKMSGSIVADLRGDDPLKRADAYAEAQFFLGESKDEVRQALRTLPPKERAEFSQTVFDAINENASIALPDDNDFARKDYLLSVFEDGYYGDVDQFVDNAISLLDVSMIGMAISRPVKAIRAGRAAKKAQEAARADELANANAAKLSDDELRAAEDAAEASAEDRKLRAQEDAYEKRVQARLKTQQEDPVRRAEDAAAKRTESRRAVASDGDALRRAEDKEETLRRGGAAAKLSDDELLKLEEAYEAEVAAKRGVQADVSEVSVSQTYRNTNPGKARAVNRAAGDDNTGQVAEALYGTNRTQAVGYDSSIEIQRSDGAIRNKVAIPDSYPVRNQPIKTVRDMYQRNGAIDLTKGEKLNVASKVVHDFNNAMGLTTRTEMTVPQVDEIGRSFKVGVVYGPQDNGWAKGPEALEHVKTSLRHYGVRDEDLTLMVRQGDSYAPVSKEAATEDGDYLVKMDYDYEISAGDVSKWDDLDVINNFFDRVPPIFNKAAGSFNRLILDAHSMLHPNITLGANVAVEDTSLLEKVLVSQSKAFSDKYNNLPKKQQHLVESEIKRANREGRNASRMELVNQGFSKAAFESMQRWRESWDTFFWLENRDMVKSLNNRNFKLLEDPTGDTRLFVKEMPRNQAGSFQRAYDPETGNMVNLDSTALKDLYEKGGTVGQLRSKFLQGDEGVDMVLIKNTPGGPYARRIRPDDQVLNYREGYYSVHYTAPKFIDRIVKDSKGNIVSRGAIATSDNTRDAERARSRLQGEAEDGVEYEIRDNRDRMRLDSDDNWNLQNAQGRVAQRTRGERLEDVTSGITDPAHNHILGPADSLLHSARNISNRVPMRDFLETTKARAMSQYADVFPKNKFGQTEFPAKPGDVVAKRGFSKRAADARTVVEYVNSLEKGFINGIDDGLKYFFRAMADISGEKGLTRTEKAFNFSAEVAAPTRLGKGTAFTLYLALNPLRQFIVQSHQAVQLLALAPKYAMTDLPGEMAVVLAARGDVELPPKMLEGLGMTKEDVLKLAEDYEMSGLSASIDKSNLVKGSLTEIADATSAGGYRKNPLARVVGKAAQGVAVSRKIGFDYGEELNMLSAWLTHRHLQLRKKKPGQELTRADMEETRALARNYTLNMTRSGEMLYNQNALGMMFQFMQVPHKSFLQWTTNRNLTGLQKSRIAAFNAVFYGAPSGTLMAAILNPVLPEDGEAREIVQQGVESYMFNKALSSMTGEDVNIDFSSLAATDGTGMYELLTDLFTTDVGEIVAATPAGSLVAGNNPRITNFLRVAAETFHFKEPSDGDRATLGETALEFAKLSSGMSNAFKAKTALEYEKSYDSYGGTSNKDVTTPEAIFQAFGFSGREQALEWAVSSDLYEARKGFEDDVKEAYRLAKQGLAREGITQDESEYRRRVMNWAWSTFKETPRAYQIIQRQLQFDIENNADDAMYRSILRQFPSMENNRAKMDQIINDAPITDEQRTMLRDMVDRLDEIKVEE